MTVIGFTLEQVICGFSVVGPPSDSCAVATNNYLPYAIKYFVELLWHVFMQLL